MSRRSNRSTRSWPAPPRTSPRKSSTRRRSTGVSCWPRSPPSPSTAIAAASPCRIDGVVRGKTPFAHPLYTEPGAHLLLAEGGGRSTSQTFAATRGTALTIPISFAANPTPAPSSEPTATPAPAAKTPIPGTPMEVAVRATQIMVPVCGRTHRRAAACGGSTDMAGGSPATPAGHDSERRGAVIVQQRAAPAPRPGPARRRERHLHPAAFTCPSTADSFTFASGGDVNIQDLWQKTMLPGLEDRPARPSPSTSPSTPTARRQPRRRQDRRRDQGRQGGVRRPDRQLLRTGRARGPRRTAHHVRRAEPGQRQPAASWPPSRTPPSRTAAPPVLLAYDSTKVTAPPKTLDELIAWIKANPGKFTYNSPSTGGSGGSFVRDRGRLHRSRPTP